MKMVKDLSAAAAPLLLWISMQGDATANYTPIFPTGSDLPTEINKLIPIEVSASQHWIRDCDISQEILRIGTINKASEWVRNFQRQLNEMRNISDNWNGYGSAAPNSRAIGNMQDVIDILYEKEITPSSLGPSADDGVGLTFVMGEKRAFIECFNQGDIVAVIYEGDGEPNVWEIRNSHPEIEDSLDKISYFIQGTHNTRRNVSQWKGS